MKWPTSASSSAPTWIKCAGPLASDRRIGNAFLFPGVGYGGSCFPKDVQAMIRFASDRDYDFKILQAVETGEPAAEGAASSRRSRSTSAT